jgi:hypothetical protein
MPLSIGSQPLAGRRTSMPSRHRARVCVVVVVRDLGVACPGKARGFAGGPAVFILVV